MRASRAADDENKRHAREIEALRGKLGEERRQKGEVKVGSGV
jgi:hypothetical protein